MSIKTLKSEVGYPCLPLEATPCVAKRGRVLFIVVYKSSTAERLSAKGRQKYVKISSPKPRTWPQVRSDASNVKNSGMPKKNHIGK